MPTLFGKLFRGKSKKDVEASGKAALVSNDSMRGEPRKQKSKRQSRKEKSSTRKVMQQQPKAINGSPKKSKQPITPTKPTKPAELLPRDENDENVIRRNPSFTATATTASGRTSSASRDHQLSPYNSPDAQASRQVLSPRNQQPKPVSQPKPKAPKRGPVDLDDTDFEESEVEDAGTRNGSRHSGLSFQQLAQFNQQQQMQQQRLHHHSANLYTMDPDPKYVKHSSEHGSVPLGLGLEESEGSVSDFNLSTDAEDEEYNTMKQRMGAGAETSVLSQHDTSTYTTDEVFPALHTDDDQSDISNPAETTPKVDSQGFMLTPMTTETEDDLRAWTLSPSQSSYKENKSSDQGKQKESNGFADFANFDDFQTSDQKKGKRSPTPRAVVEGGPSSQRGRERMRSPRSSSNSEAQKESSLSDLLAQAQKTSSKRKTTSSSINSAPALTSQYIRQYHGLRSTGSQSYTKDHPTTSVSDIIQNLEDTNQTRLRNRSRSNRSVGSRESGTNHSVRSAKERSRRRREREASASRRHRSHDGNGSDSNSDNEDFLFDEVTGALGPRGATADMDSLSVRSKSSTGNKSHRSHRSHKSHRSHRSSRRSRSQGKHNSGDSVGSRESRNSRKSTRSYLSQMSEQSRSVANDLLRLEMQLAMVGNTDEPQATPNGSASVGSSRSNRASRSSRRTSSSAISKRSKATIIAPPGKLGIILANKADSKGTVVSGVRTSSVLAEKISPGDRIIAIDGEDVSRMTVSEITTIMARKSEFERTLQILTTPKYGSTNANGPITTGLDPDGGYSSHSRR